MADTVYPYPRCSKNVENYQPNCLLTAQGELKCDYDNTNSRYGENVVLDKRYYDRVPKQVREAVKDADAYTIPKIKR